MGDKTDNNIEVIVEALWPLVKQGKLSIRRGGYLVRRGRRRLIVESAGPEDVGSPVEGGIGDAGSG